MQPRHVVAGGVRLAELGDDLIQRQRAGVDDSRVRWAQCQQVVGHDRTRVQAHRAALQQPLAADGDQVRGARARADEVDGHRVTAHWVTGNCGCQPVKAPNALP